MTTEEDRTTRGTRSQVRAWTLVLTLVTSGQAIGGEFWRSDPGHPHVHQRFRPVGGWHPDDGGLLHWWNPDCFPRCGGPDDYCRKPPPHVCWPPYPPYYLWGPLEVGPPCGNGPGVRTWQP
jgi:hypothetical protein